MLSTKRRSYPLFADDGPSFLGSNKVVTGPRVIASKPSDAQGRAVESRTPETRVLRAPAVAMCGRDVVVADDTADRPVHARTSSGAARNAWRRLARRAVIALVNTSSMSLHSRDEA
jgi:hypothetical protein